VVASTLFQGTPRVQSYTKIAAVRRKPNSVHRRLRLRGGDGVTIIPLIPPSLAGSGDLPGSIGRTVLERFPIWSCSVRGFACHLPCGRRGALLPHLFTLTPKNGDCPHFSEAVYFLCHFPSGCPDRPLAGALSCGVRTFLPPSRSALRRASPLRRTRRPAIVWLTAANFQRTLRALSGSPIRQSPAGCCTARASCRDCSGACR